jgi:hypothetical protein
MSEDKMMNTKRLYWLAPVVALVFAGCLVSITELVQFDLQGDVPFNDGIVKETIDLEAWDIDLGNLNDIEQMDLDGIVVNNGAETTIDIFVSPNSAYTTRDTLRTATDVFPVLLGFTAAANDTTVLTIPQARVLLQLSGQNWVNIKKLISDGLFTVYFASESTAISGKIVKANLWVRFNLGKPR